MSLRKKILTILFLIMSSICVAQCLYTQKQDKFVRNYFSPVKIIWQSDTSENYIFNSEKLLIEGNGQADLIGANFCIIKGGDKTNSAILFDFGKEIHGGLQIVTGMFAENLHVRVKVTLGESVSEAMSEVNKSSATNDHAIREYVVSLPWLGSIEIGNSGFRFAKIELLDQQRELKIKEIRAIAVQRDILWLGSFKSNDDRLNQIWHTGAYTVYLNMQNFLWDGIKRDRLVWVGDMHPEIMTILSVFGYNEVVPKSLGLIREITKLPDYMNGISSYSMWWILIQYQWFLNNGDIEYLKNNKDYIYSTLDILQKKIDIDGCEKLDGMRFLDWPTSSNTLAIHAGLQSMMIMTFDAGRKISQIFKDKDKEVLFTQIIKQLKQHSPDPNNSKAGAALLALSGLQDPKTINDNYLSLNPTDDISTFYGYYVLQARAMAGDYIGAIDLIRQYWGGMIDLGATTFWEDFDLKWMEKAGRIDEITPVGKIDVHTQYGNYCYKGLRNSLCHGWASGPTAWLSEHVLGVKVLEAGCRKIKIEPHLGDLEWVEGTYPTKFGVIFLRHEKRKDGSIKSIIKTPKGITVVK